MRSWIVPSLTALLLTSAGGCTVSIQPWTKPTPAAPAIDPMTGLPHNMPAGFPPNPRALPAGANSNNEATSQLIRQFNETDDQRRVLLDEVNNLRKQLKDRESAPNAPCTKSRTRPSN